MNDNVINTEDPPFPHHRTWFVALMLATALLRLILLFTSQRYLQSDEALVGMIALDILDGKGIPVFPYGNAYGGGHIIEALMMVPLFAIFGPSGILVSAIPAIESCFYVAIVYFALCGWIGKRKALVSASLFSISAPFVACSFYVNGSMTTGALGWLGLCLYNRSHRRETHASALLFLSALSLGLAYYSFDYALFYLFCILLLEALRGLRRFFDGWRGMAAFISGFNLGAMPLIVFNLTNDFANLKNLTQRTVGGEAVAAPGFGAHLVGLFVHDLPAFFSVNIYDFADSISSASWIAYSLFIIALAWSVWMSRGSWSRVLHRAINHDHSESIPADRGAAFLLLFALYVFIYAASSSAGQTPRYLIPFYPLIPILCASFVIDQLARSRRIAFGFAALFIACQFFFIVPLARETRTTEWNISTEGADIAKLAQFLEDRGLTTVLTPYEIKWKLMFESERRIACASYLFGFDRESDYNREVIDRVNRLGITPALVLDKEFKMAEIAKNFNPKGAFDLPRFMARLKDAGITYQQETVGDYVVMHGFSRSFAIPDPYSRATTH